VFRTKRFLTSVSKHHLPESFDHSDTAYALLYGRKTSL